MILAGSPVFYVIMFLATYIQVFFLLVFFENRKIVRATPSPKKLAYYPKITVVMPAWNEEESIVPTIYSLLESDYPTEKLDVIAVDDGSTDATWDLLQEFKNHPRVQIFTKPNGGKATAVNLGLSKTTSEYVACLDADTYVHPQAFKRIFKMFAEHPEYSAVIPAAIIHNPTTIIQQAQKVEYNMSIFYKKLFSLLGGLHVTPGTLPIYKREIFDEIGGFRKAHNGEDMEMAFRMQQRHMLIGQCHEAQVYTLGPKTIRELFKQRLRWIYAYINNVIDYRQMLFSGKYGYFAYFTIPAGIIGILSVITIFGIMISQVVRWIIQGIEYVIANGLHLHTPSVPDLFYIETSSIFFIVMIAYGFVFFAMLMGNKMAEGRYFISVKSLYFLGIYSIISPLWLIRSVYNTIFNRKYNDAWLR